MSNYRLSCQAAQNWRLRANRDRTRSVDRERGLNLPLESPSQSCSAEIAHPLLQR
jgi:hypothetical protein